MCEMSIIARGTRWVLLDWDCLEVGQYVCEAEALQAAHDYLKPSEPSFILVGSADGEWRERLLDGRARPH